MYSSTRNLIKTIVIDDNTLARCGIKTLLSDDSETSVVYESDCCKYLFDLLMYYQPDILLISIDLFFIHYNEEWEKLISSLPNLKTVGLSASTKLYNLYPIMMPYLHGCLVKEMKSEELKIAIQTVHHGGFYYSKEIADFILNRKKSNTSFHAATKFTSTEKSILELCCEGYINKEIAAMLQLAPKTIEHYKERLLLKTGCKNVTSLAVYAIINNIIRIKQSVCTLGIIFLSKLLNIRFVENFLEI